MTAVLQTANKDTFTEDVFVVQINNRLISLLDFHTTQQ